MSSEDHDPDSTTLAPRNLEAEQNSFEVPMEGEEPTIEPRIWTVWLTLGVAFGAMIIASVVAAVCVLAPAMFDGSFTPEKSNELLMQPIALLGVSVPPQLAIMLVALGAAYLSPIALRERIRLVDSGLSTTDWLASGVSCFLPTAIGLVLATLLTYLIPADESAAMIFSSMTPALAIPWILFIALAPGFGEEILFRGYAQSRLAERIDPGIAIVLTSGIFALFHLMPHTVIFAFPIGCWLGFIAWKTGSIWPTILGHALVNGTWNILNIGHNMFGFSDAIYNAICIVLVLVGILCFWRTWVVLKQRQPGIAVGQHEPAAFL